MEKSISTKNVIKVMVVDDHALVRTGLKFIIEAHSGLALAGEASTGEEALALCMQEPPDVILMDLMMPGINGVEATHSIRESCPSTQVIALTSFADERLISSALKAGAISYLLKDTSAENLVAAVRAAHAGRSTLAPEVTQILVTAISAQRQLGRNLNDRERLVLQLMARGMTNKEIARALCLSSSTIKANVSSVLSKLGVSNRTEAVRLALEHHIET